MNHSSQTPLLDRLVERIALDNPLQERALVAARTNLLPAESAELESYVRLCVEEGHGLENLAAAYRTITLDTLREQIYFKRHGRYRHATFKDVADQVYFDPAYMTRYMYGLALTLFLWPNHLEIVRFFRNVLPRRPGGKYLEIGPGHGVFFRHAARHGGFASCLGVDLSPTSLELTRKLLASDPSLASSTRWSLQLADFLEADDLATDYDAVVMGEVLEHVEQPGRFLERISSLTRDDAFIFVTTAVNAPAVDHIYLFPSVMSVRELAAASGLRVVDELATAYQGCTMEETVEQRLPINVALVLAK